GGALATITISTVAAGGHGHRVQLFGDGGSLQLANPELDDYMRGFTLTKEPGGPVAVPAAGAEDGRIEPFARLVRTFLDGDPEVPSFSSGARAQELADAVRASGAG